MNVEQVLEGAIETVKMGWMQGDLAENATGDPVDPLSPSAVRWCIVGALTRVEGEEITFRKDTPGLRAIQALESLLEDEILSNWNDEDDRTQEDVLSVLNLALERVRNNAEVRT